MATSSGSSRGSMESKPHCPGAKPRIRQLNQDLMPRQRPGDFVQALMDLGATVCTPKRPACERCPWSIDCVARGKVMTADLPRKAPKPDRPLRHAVAFWAVDPDGRVFLRRRPESGLLGGMTEIPSTPWTDGTWCVAAARKQAPLRARWQAAPGIVTHGFTHFQIEFQVLCARVNRQPQVLGSPSPGPPVVLVPVAGPRPSGVANAHEKTRAPRSGTRWLSGSLGSE